MRVGLIDVDGHNFPNTALMRLSSYHKAKGDSVEWWWGFDHYDIVYMSRVFNDSYSEDLPEPANADIVIKGGSGYAIDTIHGIEVYDKDRDPCLPKGAECIMPDYSLYPEYTKNRAYGSLTKGCPKKCPWCHVCAMQGTETKQICELSDFRTDQHYVTLSDPNLLAAPNREDLLLSLRDAKVAVDFNQGLDLQRMDEDVIGILNSMRGTTYHFAWDDPSIDLTDQFAFVGARMRVKAIKRRMTYVLTNFAGSGVDDTLWRIETLRGLSFDPFVMIYNKPEANQELHDLQRWCNNKFLFNSCTFDEYKEESK